MSSMGLNYFNIPESAEVSDYPNSSLSIPFQLREREDAVWWFTLAFQKLRWHSLQKQADYILLYLESPEEASKQLEGVGDYEREKFVEDIERICFFLVMEGIKLPSPPVGIRYIDRLKSVFDHALQYHATCLDSLLRKWFTQRWSILFLKQKPDLLLVDLFLRTHQLPDSYKIFEALLPYSTKLYDALRYNMMDSGGELDLRKAALKGMRLDHTVAPGVWKIEFDKVPKKRLRIVS